MSKNLFRPITDLDKLILLMNKGMEGTIVTDDNGNRWRFHNGRYEAMCVVKTEKQFK